MSGDRRSGAPPGKPRPEVTTGQDEERTRRRPEDPGDGIGRITRAARGQGLGRLGGDGDSGDDDKPRPCAASATAGESHKSSRDEPDHRVEGECLVFP
jgi:hypothetical protein